MDSAYRDHSSGRCHCKVLGNNRLTCHAYSISVQHVVSEIQSKMKPVARFGQQVLHHTTQQAGNVHESSFFCDSRCHNPRTHAPVSQRTESRFAHERLSLGTSFVCVVRHKVVTSVPAKRYWFAGGGHERQNISGMVILDSQTTSHFACRHDRLYFHLGSHWHLCNRYHEHGTQVHRRGSSSGGRLLVRCCGLGVFIHIVSVNQREPRFDHSRLN